MSGVFPLSVVIRPGSHDDTESLVQVAGAILPSPIRAEFRSHRRGIELRCVYVNDAEEIVATLNDCLNSHVRISERTVRFLTEPDLMEPVMRMEIRTIAAHVPVIMTLVNDLRGTVSERTSRADHDALICEAPLQEILDMPSRLRSVSDGEARLEAVTFSHYQKA